MALEAADAGFLDNMQITPLVGWSLNATCNRVIESGAMKTTFQEDERINAYNRAVLIIVYRARHFV